MGNAFETQKYIFGETVNGGENGTNTVRLPNGSRPGPKLRKPVLSYKELARVAYPPGHNTADYAHRMGAAKVEYEPIRATLYVPKHRAPVATLAAMVNPPGCNTACYANRVTW
jgi:hypothetical protein